MLRALRFVTLLLAALSLAATTAHVLEMPQKLGWDLELYSTVNGSLYRYFAIVGGAVQLLALVAAAWLALRLRARSAIAGAALLAASFASWLALVQPVNAAIADTAAGERPAAWGDGLRDRWETGHAVGFALQLLGFALLLGSTVADTPLTASRAAPSPAASPRARDARAH